MKRVIHAVLPACLTLAVGVGALAADPTPPAPAAAMAPAKTMTTAQLGQLLSEAGFKLTPNKNDQGEADSYSGTIEYAGGYQSPFTFALSQNQKYVWINVALTRIADLGKVPAEVLVKMLQSHASSGTASFYIDSAGMLRLHAVLSVDGLTADSLKAEVEYIESQVVATVQLWTPAALGQTPPEKKA